MNVADKIEENMREMFVKHLYRICELCYENSKKHGFWDGPTNNNVGNKIALMHSELSELLEAFRNNPNAHSEHIPNFTAIEEECADIFIRLADFSFKHKIFLGNAILGKMDYNATRPHKHNKEF